VAVGIVGAAAGVDIEHAAGNAGVVDVPGILILELMHAALGAAGAQGFPLLSG